MIFSEIRADHTVDGLKIDYRARPVWEPYVEAVLARQRQFATDPSVITSERKTGLGFVKRILARTFDRLTIERAFVPA